MTLQQWRLFRLGWWLRRWLICSLFHAEHFKLTEYFYYRQTGLGNYCSKCNEWKMVGGLIDYHPKTNE